LAVYKRNIFVINPKFQYKFSFIVCSLIFISSLIYPFTIYEIFESFFRLDPSKAHMMQTNRNELLKWLVGIQFMYISVVFLVCIFISHKIAGPMYKLSNYLKNIIAGNSPERLYFRNGDNFTDIADLFNQAMERLEEDRSNDFQYLSEVSSYIKNLSVVVPEDKKPVLNEIIVKLNEIQTRFDSKSNG
jgi:sensor histidine kinase YesM